MLPEYVKKTEENYNSLTKGLRKVADSLLHDPHTFAIHPAKKIGILINVSETMIIRYSRAIGYEGFSELQNAVRRDMMQFRSDNLSTIGTEAATSPFQENMKKDLQLIESNLHSLDNAELSQIVDVILKSERVIVMGYYQSNTFANWLYFNLNYITGNAYLYRPEIDARLLQVTPKQSSIIVFSFYRYAMNTLWFVEEAKAQGLKVIVITDSKASPAAKFADHLIVIRLTSAALLRKGPVTLTVINTILEEVAKKIEQTDTVPVTYKYFIRDGGNTID